MTRFALRSVLSHGRRALLTMFAVFLGVAAITGTLVFTDTIDSAFRALFLSSDSGAQVVVASRHDVGSPISAPTTMSASLIRRIRALPGVSAAQGQIVASATIVGTRGQALGSAGLPTLALSYLPPPFSGLRFTAGGRPHGSREVAIDAGTAARQHLGVGEAVRIVTDQPARSFLISGIVAPGRSSLGGSTLAVFDLGTARGLYGLEHRADTIDVAARPGASAAALIGEIRPLLGPQFVVRRVAAQVSADAGRLDSQLSLVSTGLLAFAVIAVLVGAFLIFNTFSITLAQRGREFALLRALGAMRRQVLGAVLLEAGAVGFIGAALGLAGGLAAALAIRAVLGAVGLDLPSATLALRPRTVLIGLAVGIGATFVAALAPAIRVVWAPPLAALRGSEAPRPRRSARAVRLALAVVLAAGGAAVMFTGSGALGTRAERSALGAIPLLLAGVLALPLVVVPLADVVSWPLEWRGGVISRLARENAGRSPLRTAVSAGALVIGLALVLFVSVYASSLRSSTREIVSSRFTGDLAIQSHDAQEPIPPAATQAVAGLPNLVDVSSIKSAPARLGRAGEITASGIDPTSLGQVYDFDWVEGSSASLSGLAPGQALVEQDTARAAGLSAGEHVSLVTETGTRLPLTIAGIFSDRALLSGVLVERAQFDQAFDQPRLQDVLLKLAPGSGVASAKAAVSRALAAFPGVVVRTRRQLVGTLAGRAERILVLFYALLALSVLMSLLAVAGTMYLSVHERTRELGVLRAMGMTRRQASALIRDETLITAAIGSLVGVGLGLVIGWTLTRSLAGEGISFTVSWLFVAGVLVAGLLTGVLAALAPARRAARLDILAAIAHE